MFWLQHDNQPSTELLQCNGKRSLINRLGAESKRVFNGYLLYPLISFRISLVGVLCLETSSS